LSLLLLSLLLLQLQLLLLLQLQLLLLLFVLAVILSAAKDPEAPYPPIPLEPLNQYRSNRRRSSAKPTVTPSQAWAQNWNIIRYTSGACRGLQPSSRTPTTSEGSCKPHPDTHTKASTQGSGSRQTAQKRRLNHLRRLSEKKTLQVHETKF
jgi:hypothetical protein